MGSSERAVADIFNSAVAASAISAAWELGLLDEIRTRGVVNVQAFAGEHELDAPSLLGLCRALSAVDVVEREGAKVSAGALFEETCRTRSFFHWLTRGSGDLFQRMPEVARTGSRKGDYYRRDSAAIAYACREISSFCYDPWFWEALDGLDFDVRVVADLGCGSGERLLQVLRRHPRARALGIDIARPALDFAQAAADAEGLGDRVEFVHADVLDMAPRPEFAEVDVLTCFMMGHDFWPRERCGATLRRLGTLFPRARRLLIGDATRSEGLEDAELPVFTLGFELAHDLMGTFIPTRGDWESVFGESGWTLRRTHAIDIAVGEVIFELDRT
ncbi:class I SAM-dependent methyltransferase [Streptomyces sp. NRRL WC-3742]|uniref:class I SAM-dependent methyltransferase n=1 Tax=Streptomyces sp. NRRL WC-3742 TaxID=1463934 RepID=UPI001F3FF669|nr:class I SAM-dependent methyltransferase [Streptomyces sp. NRRL WC-3742]